MQKRNRTFAAIAAIAFVVACSTGENESFISTGKSSLPPDSAINPIIVRVTDQVPDSEVHQVKEEMVISAGAKDTSTFTRVDEFVIDKAGHYWVYDNAVHTLVLFDSSGKFIARVGRKGEGPGEFRMNSGMVALSDGRVAHWDDGNSRVSFFSATGKYLEGWHMESGSVRFRSLVKDASGQLFVKRTVWSQAGAAGRAPSEYLLRVTEKPTAADTLVVPNLRIPEVEYIIGSEDGGDNMTMVMATVAEYAPKMLWDWHPQGFFVTGHGALYQITLFRTKERPIRIERSSPPVPVDPEEKRMEELMILGGKASRKWQGPPLPVVKPALMDLFVARDGRIWARVPMPSVKTTTVNTAAKPGQPATMSTYSTPVTWEIFSAEGQFLGRVALPGRAKLMQADGNTVWAKQLDDDDLESVVRYRIEPPIK